MKNKESTFNLAWRLTLICALSALLLGGAYQLTFGEIAARDQEVLKQSQQIVLPQAQEFQELSKPSGYPEVQSLFRGVNQSETVGYVVNISTKGYNSGLNVAVGIHADGSVSNVYITSMQETPGLGSKASEPVFLGQFAGKVGELKVVKNPPSLDSEIQAISGATLSSKGVTHAVNLALTLCKELGGAK